MKIQSWMYMNWLHSDSGNTFAEHLGITVPRLERDIYGQCRFVRVKTGTFVTEIIYGEWCRTQKEAKASYKAALAASKTQQKAGDL